jgi:hypothetical protein
LVAGVFHETPARELPDVAFEQSQRIAALQGRYQVHFEDRMSAATSTNNYEYLDILDRAWADSGLPRPEGGVVCDVGSASFGYAAALPPDTWVRYRVRGSWWQTMSIANCRPT